MQLLGAWVGPEACMIFLVVAQTVRLLFSFSNLATTYVKLVNQVRNCVDKVL